MALSIVYSPYLEHHDSVRVGALRMALFLPEGPGAAIAFLMSRGGDWEVPEVSQRVAATNEWTHISSFGGADLIRPWHHPDGHLAYIT